MSLFKRIFGKKLKEKPPKPHETVKRIREIEESLGKKSVLIEGKIQKELEAAKKHGTQNKKCKNEYKLFILDQVNLEN